MKIHNTNCFTLRQNKIYNIKTSTKIKIEPLPQTYPQPLSHLPPPKLLEIDNGKTSEDENKMLVVGNANI